MVGCVGCVGWTPWVDGGCLGCVGCVGWTPWVDGGCLGWWWGWEPKPWGMRIRDARKNTSKDEEKEAILISVILVLLHKT